MNSGKTSQTHQRYVEQKWDDAIIKVRYISCVISKLIIEVNYNSHDISLASATHF